MLAGFFSIFIFTIAWLPNDDPSDIKEKTLNLGKIFFKIFFYYNYMDR